MNSPKDANKFMMCFLIYNCFAIVILTISSWGLVFKGMSESEVMQFILLAQDFVVFIVPMAVYMILTGKSIKEIVPLKRLSGKNAVYVIIITFLMMPMMWVFSIITNMFVESDVSESFRQIMTDFPWWVSIIFMAIMPPLCEETMFRGYILTGYKSVGFVKAAVISALFFGMMHLDLYQLPYATFAGIVFAGFVYYTGSIYSSMLAHFIVNGSQTAMFLITTKLMDITEMEEEMEVVATMDEQIASLYTMIGIMVVCLPFLLYFINRFVKRNRANYIEYCTDATAIAGIGFETEKTKQKCIDKFFVITVIIYAGYMILFK